VALAAKKTKALRHGYNGHDADLGAIATEKQLLSLKENLQAALAQGASIVAQSQAVGGQAGYFFPATLLVNVHSDADFIQEEIFGPFMPVVKVSSEQEAIMLANRSQYGLTASVWTRSNARGRKVAEQLEVGAVTVNDHLYSHGIANTEWGGPKNSGIGRTHGALGLKELTESKIINWDLFPVKRNAFWFPFDEKLYRLMLNVVEFANPKSLFQWLKLNVTMFPVLLKRMFSKWDL
jgi:succinate-semialdehyde dehydrogenase/glutarate-semialdehyde dehydrogenase